MTDSDREIPWDDLSPEGQEQQLKLNRALFQDSNWLPPEGFTVLQITIPAEMWDKLFSDDELRCPTNCDDDCDADCHEWHEVVAKRHHNPYTCPGATPSGLRRDLDEKARDDMVDRWHDTGGAPDGQPVDLHDYLGMTEDQYGEWLRDPTSWKPS